MSAENQTEVFCKIISMLSAAKPSPQKKGRDGSVFMEMFVEVILENTFSMVKGMQTASKPSHDFHVFFL